MGETEATVDLSDNPWAGAQVKMTLTAHDGGGNMGKSEPIQITPAVASLSTSAISTSEIDRSWALNATNASETDIYASTDGSTI